MANLELVSANIGTSMLSISDMLRTDVVGLWRGVLWPTDIQIYSNNFL